MAWHNIQKQKTTQHLDGKMITYSTNWMGPVALRWYRERGLLEEGSVHPTQHYAAGRIDIRGLDETEYYCGWSEYGLAPMMSEDWGALTKWLDTLQTDVLLSYDELINRFETETNCNIMWAE